MLTWFMQPSSMYNQQFEIHCSKCAAFLIVSFRDANRLPDLGKRLPWPQPPPQLRQTGKYLQVNFFLVKKQISYFFSED